LTECFARYGATLRNVQWAVSDVTDGRLVVSLWQHLFHKGDEGAQLYEDHVTRWKGQGNSLFRQHLEEAHRLGLPVKAVIARAEDTEAVDRGVDAKTIRKTFSIWPRMTGRVTAYDGDKFVIEFRPDLGP
jgi:hypothetical protein